MRVSDGTHGQGAAGASHQNEINFLRGKFIGHQSKRILHYGSEEHVERKNQTDIGGAHLFCFYGKEREECIESPPVKSPRSHVGHDADHRFVFEDRKEGLEEGTPLLVMAFDGGTFRHEEKHQYHYQE